MFDIADFLINDTYQECNVRIYLAFVHQYFKTTYVNIYHTLEYVKMQHKGHAQSFKLIKLEFGSDNYGNFYDVDYTVGT